MASAGLAGVFVGSAGSGGFEPESGIVMGKGSGSALGVGTALLGWASTGIGS